MEDSPVLICYDDSDASRRAIDVAAAVLGRRRAVVLDVGPYLTSAESIALTSSVVPGSAFEDANENDALRRARLGAQRAREAGFKLLVALNVFIHHYGSRTFAGLGIDAQKQLAIVGSFTPALLSTGYHKYFPSLTASAPEDKLGVGGESICEVPNPLIQLN